MKGRWAVNSIGTMGCCAIVVGAFASVAASQNCDWAWEAIGADGDVNSMIVFDDGSGTALYAGGYFSTIGGLYSPFLAKFDGHTWSSVGDGVDNTVSALGIHDDGTGPALYVGGRIKKAGGVTVSHVAKWDGRSWGAVGDGIEDAEDTVLSLASIPGPHGDTLYAGGYFLKAGGPGYVWGMAALKNGHWTKVGEGSKSAVRCMSAYDDGRATALYAGGRFQTPQGTSIYGVGRWDGASWTDPGTAFNPPPALVWAMLNRTEAMGDALYIGGAMKFSGELAINGICRWDGNSCSALGAGFDNNDAVFALASHRVGSSELLIAGGDITRTGDKALHNIAAWDGHSWSPIGEGVGDNYVWSLASVDFGDGPILFVGGWFEEAGGLYSPNLAMVRCVPICIADCDGSGAIDLADFACFQSSFAAGDLKADCDGNATLDLFDFLCFLNAFNEGCP